MSYEDRLNHLSLDTLKNRCLRADLVTVYKTFHGSLGIDGDVTGLQLQSNATTQSN